MKVIGFVGWRGMVGSVLRGRMMEENDFSNFKTILFSTSSHGFDAPKLPNAGHVVCDGNDIELLKKCDVILTCQGSDYSKKIYPALVQEGWNGYWIDAASGFRMDDDAMIALDPINYDSIVEGIARGVKKFIGSNCTVGLLLMAIHGLFKEGLVDWVNASTYQSVSGGGANNMREMLNQMGQLYACSKEELHTPASSILDIDRKILECQTSENFPTNYFGGTAIAGNLIPWIDSDMGNGTSREEWKGEVELNKILDFRTEDKIHLESTCVRVGVMRCHSQSLLISLKKDCSLKEVEEMLQNGNEWVNIVPNNKEDSTTFLNPIHISNTLNIGVGRIRKLSISPKLMNVFTVGDQLLWGAAEPLRRVLNIILAHT